MDIESIVQAVRENWEKILKRHQELEQEGFESLKKDVERLKIENKELLEKINKDDTIWPIPSFDTRVKNDEK